MWSEVADYLEFSIYRIRIIQKQFRGYNEECCCHLLEEWIGTNQGVTPKNWATLLSVLRQNELDIADCCDEIEKDLKW